jgi:hypothetical protein
MMRNVREAQVGQDESRPGTLKVTRSTEATADLSLLLSTFHSQEE